SWTSLLEFSVMAPNDDADVLGDTPTLILNPGSSVERTVETKRERRPTTTLTEVNDSATFEVPTNELVYMLDRGRTFKLNGKQWSLEEGEIKVMRELLLRARDDTRAGR